jgi:hypothetical protein
MKGGLVDRRAVCLSASTRVCPSLRVSPLNYLGGSGDHLSICVSPSPFFLGKRPLLVIIIVISLCVSVSAPPLNSSVFFVVHVTSNVSKRLVLSRTSFY